VLLLHILYIRQEVVSNFSLLNRSCVAEFVHLHAYTKNYIMKINEVKTKIMQAFLEHTKITAQQMAYSYGISNPQFYGFGKMLIDAGAVTKQDKTYTLINKEKMAKAFELELPGESK